MATNDGRVVFLMHDDGFGEETAAGVALDLLGRLHVVTSYYADQGIHAGEVRMRLEGYLTPGEAGALRKIMQEARHGTGR